MEEKDPKEFINTDTEQDSVSSSIKKEEEATSIPNFVLQDIEEVQTQAKTQPKLQETQAEGKASTMQAEKETMAKMESPHNLPHGDTHISSQEDVKMTDCPQPQKKHTSTKQTRTPMLLAACLLIGGIGGFGGTYLASSLQGNSTQTVLYQSVEKTDSEGNSVTNMSVKDVVTNTSNSVVEITTESAATDSFLQQMVTTGAGSGVIISKDGYIVTNNHVVEGASKVTVRTKDGTEYDAKIIGTDSTTDLAVIKIEASDLSAATMGSSSNLSVGDEAIAIGNPLGELGGTVTQGIISALDREISIDGQTMTLLQTDTAINKGNSGGGLFNNNGELIGIVNAKSSGSSVEGLGFAIPIDTAKPVIHSLIENGYVTGRPQLGVSMVNIEDETSAFQAGVNELGVYIAKVNSGSAAEEAGLKVRDRVISVEGTEISSSSQISKIVSSKQVGDSLTMVVERDGKEVTITATLKEEVKDTSNNQSSNSDSKSQNSNPYSKYFQ